MSQSSLRGWWIWPVVAIGLVVVPVPAPWVDTVYSGAIYRVIQISLTTLSNLTPFAWLDVWLIGVVLLAAWRLTRLAGAAKHGARARVLWEAVCRVVRAVGVATVAFLFLWGLNYRGVSLETSFGTSSSTAPVAELEQTLRDANVLAARLRTTATAHPVSYEEAADQLEQPFELAVQEVGRPPLGVFGRPKYSLLTPYFTWAGIDGMINPYGLEAIVHPDALPFERPLLLAHEWAHLAGEASEASASAVGWLACMHGDPTLAYSATVYLVAELGNALPPDVWRADLPALDPGLRADLDAIAVRAQRAQPVVQRTASGIYDKYLKANGVAGGVRNYDRALALILVPQFRQAINSYPADRFR